MNSQPTILIVDDNKKNLQVLGSFLREQEWRIVVAIDGAAALKLVERLLPDLILLDIMMPEMDGYEVCRKLKSKDQTKEIPVIFLTAKNDTEDIVEGFRVGGVDYITKPFKQEELIARIKTHIELQRSKAIIREQADKLKKTIKTKEKMYGIIGHDLRGPIGNMSMLFDHLTSDSFELTDQENLELIDSLRKTAKETFYLLENLLYWANFQTGSIAFNPENINVNEITGQTFYLLTSSAGNKNIELINKTGDDFVRADKNMVKTVMRNLVSNAIKFTQSGGKVVVSAKNEGEMIKISISDNGIGLSEDKRKKLFRDDEIITSRGTDNESGSGLGLKLSKEFIEMNKGKIDVESRIGEGTTFYFILPEADK